VSAEPLAGRPPSYARTSTTEYVLPTHANALGNVFGGQILAWMDLCGAICAQRHSGAIAVTAGIDELAFEQSIKVGQVALVEARVTAAFRTSLEVEVFVHGEEPATGRTWPCVRAFLTFVAIDASGSPQRVPPLLVETDAERALAADAASRRAERLSRRPSPIKAPPTRG
jgi:acyl-CoA hydrolase